MVELIGSYTKVDAFMKHTYLGYLIIFLLISLCQWTLRVTYGYKKSYRTVSYYIIYPINSSNFYNIEINYTLFSNKMFNSSPSSFAFDNFIPNVALGKGTILTTYPTGFFTFILS